VVVLPDPCRPVRQPVAAHSVAAERLCLGEAAVGRLFLVVVVHRR